MFRLSLQFILSFFFLYLNSVHAEKIISCTPTNGDSSFTVSEESDKVIVKILNSKGYNALDQYEGPISPNTLPSITQQFEALRDINNEISFSWEKQKCQINKELFTVHCEGKALTSSKDITAYTLSTTEVSEKLKNSEYQKRKYRVVLEKGNDTFFLTMLFYKQNCF